MNTYTLPNTWVLWFHNSSNDWTINSYINVFEIKTIQDFWEIYLRLNTLIVQGGMFFLMKKNIEPLWENEDNINGGCWSYKINKNDSLNAWTELSMYLCSEKLLKDENIFSKINGISISPKKSFCILKIWNNDSQHNSVELINNKIPYFNVSKCIYKAHVDRN